MTKTLPISEARKELRALVESAHRTLERTIITRQGKPEAVLLSYAEFESWLETLDVLADHNEITAIRNGLDELAAGLVESFEEVFKTPQSAVGAHYVSRLKTSPQTAKRIAGPLSEADRDLMMLLAEGLPPRAIARRLKISSRALARRKAEIRKRLTMSSQGEGGYIFEVLRRMLGPGSEAPPARRSQHADPEDDRIHAVRR